MYIAMLITQAILLIVEYYVYLNDKDSFEISNQYVPILEIHSQIMFVTLVVEFLVLMFLWTGVDFNYKTNYFKVASPFLMVVRASLHLVYLFDVIIPNNQRRS